MLNKSRNILKILGCATVALVISAALKTGALGNGMLKNIPINVAKNILVDMAWLDQKGTFVKELGDGTKIHCIVDADQKHYCVVFYGGYGGKADVYTLDSPRSGKFHLLTNPNKVYAIRGDGYFFDWLYDEDSLEGVSAGVTIGERTPDEESIVKRELKNGMTMNYYVVAGDNSCQYFVQNADGTKFGVYFKKDEYNIYYPLDKSDTRVFILEDDGNFRPLNESELAKYSSISPDGDDEASSEDEDTEVLFDDTMKMAIDVLEQQKHQDVESYFVLQHDDGQGSSDLKYMFEDIFNFVMKIDREKNPEEMEKLRKEARDLLHVDVINNHTVHNSVCGLSNLLLYFNTANVFDKKNEDGLLISRAIRLRAALLWRIYQIVWCPLYLMDDPYKERVLFIALHDNLISFATNYSEIITKEQVESMWSHMQTYLRTIDEKSVKKSEIDPLEKEWVKLKKCKGISKKLVKEMFDRLDGKRIDDTKKKAFFQKNYIACLMDDSLVKFKSPKEAHPNCFVDEDDSVLKFFMLADKFKSSSIAVGDAFSNVIKKSIEDCDDGKLEEALSALHKQREETRKIFNQFAKYDLRECIDPSGRTKAFTDMCDLWDSLGRIIEFVNSERHHRVFDNFKTIKNKFTKIMNDVFARMDDSRTKKAMRSGRRQKSKDGTNLGNISLYEREISYEKLVPNPPKQEYIDRLKELKVELEALKDSYEHFKKENYLRCDLSKKLDFGFKNIENLIRYLEELQELEKASEKRYEEEPELQKDTGTEEPVSALAAASVSEAVMDEPAAAAAAAAAATSTFEMKEDTVEAFKHNKSVIKDIKRLNRLASKLREEAQRRQETREQKQLRKRVEREKLIEKTETGKLYKAFYFNETVKDKALAFLSGNVDFWNLFKIWCSRVSVEGTTTTRALRHMGGDKDFLSSVGLNNIRLTPGDCIYEYNLHNSGQSYGAVVVYYVEKDTDRVIILYVGSHFGKGHANERDEVLSEGSPVEVRLDNFCMAPKTDTATDMGKEHKHK